MRAGGCTVQQALTTEAAAVVKQAVSLARRRGNAQVTPLHVASAMLQAAAPPGLLRAACLRSHSHPLQCKALELCFNVALNRLPASAASPLLGGGAAAHHVYYPPSLSNALVAAFKRAQAHQRRGSVEAQQQAAAVLAVKIELEQLVVSILDDPSVSRVMREAGFSSTQVKANVEHAVSLSSVEGNNPSSTNAAAAAPQNPNPSSSPSPQEAKPSKLPLDQVREEDVAAILDCMATRAKRRVMVVAECAAAAEAAARAALDRITRGDTRHDALRGARVVSLRASRFRDAPRGEAERRLAELRCAVARAGATGGVVLVVEDIRWAAEFWGARRAAPAASCYYYCAVEHAVAEVRALACGGAGVWLVSYGTYQTYMRCRAGNPSLESLWGLQTLAVPAGSLALSLNCVDVDSAMAAVNHQSISKARRDRSGNGSPSTSPSPCLSLLDAAGGCSGKPMAVSTCCCGGCSATKALLPRSVVAPSPSSIPSWLHHCRDQEPPHWKKWMSSTALNISTGVSPSSSVSSYEQYYHLHQPYQPWLATDGHEPKQHPWKAKHSGDVHVAAAGVKVKSDDSSASNGSVEVEECRSRFKELSAENLKLLCGALEKEVPWQRDIVPEIASTVLRCRSGMARRRRRDGGANAKSDTWMLFLGGDTDGKTRVARELAGLVFGSRRSFISIGGSATTPSSSSPSPARSDSTEQHRSKRPRPAAPGGCLERLFEAVRDDPHRVIVVDGVEHAGQRCQLGIREAIESGVVRSRRGGEASVGDAIVVLCCESFDSRSRACSPPATKKTKAESEEEGTNDSHGKQTVVVTSSATTSSCFDLNMSVDDDDGEECCLGDADAVLLRAVDRALFFVRPPEELCLINRPCLKIN